MKDAITQEIIPDATVTAKLLDPANADALIGGSTFALPSTNAGKGNYGSTSPELDLELGKVYTLDIQGVKGGSTILWDQISVVAGYGDGS